MSMRGILMGCLLASVAAAQVPRTPVNLESSPQGSESRSGILNRKPTASAAGAAKLMKPQVQLPPQMPAVASADQAKGSEAVRLQIFLDSQHLGPGVIDGRIGTFTHHAIESWNEIHGHPVSDRVAVMRAAQQAVQAPLAIATVPNVASKWLNPDLPTDRELQSKVKRLGYRSLAEFMAERYHTDVEFLEELNGAARLKKLAVGDEVVVPAVAPFVIEALNGVQFQRREDLAQRHVVVDTVRHQLRIYDGMPTALLVHPNEEGGTASVSTPNRALVASFPITPGQKKFIHFGMWQVKTCVELPTWRYDKLLLETGKRSKQASAVFDLPPGPNSPVGVLWAGLDKPGIGLHGTADPETIGRAQSAGCIRLANWDAIRLPLFISPGTTVEIR